MAILHKARGFLGRYGRAVAFLKILAPLFGILFYVFLVMFALFAVVGLILVFVSTDVSKMLLPPHMKALRDSFGEITSYSLKLGNGLKIVSPVSDITLSHIKLVVYAKLCSYGVTLVFSAMALRLTSKLFTNVVKGKVLSEENAKHINYTGVLVMVGGVVYSVVNNLFNYIQVKRFAADLKVNYSFDIEWFGIIMGMFIIVIGTIYGYACFISSQSHTAITPGESSLGIEVKKNK